MIVVHNLDVDKCTRCNREFVLTKLVVSASRTCNRENNIFYVNTIRT